LVDLARPVLLDSSHDALLNNATTFRRSSRNKLQSLFGIYLFVICLFVICLVIICLLVCYVRMTIWCKLGALFVNFLWPVEPENRDVQRSRSGPLMSALGQKQTWGEGATDVRFTPKSGH
jgi:hypothetical protein